MIAKCSESDARIGRLGARRPYGPARAWLRAALLLAAASGPVGAQGPDPDGGAVCVAPGALSARLTFADAAAAGRRLARADDWSSRLSAFERSARRRTTDPTTTAELLEHVSDQGLDWTAEERAHWGRLVERLDGAVAGLNPTIPEAALVKSTGLDEFGAAYARKQAIVLPRGRIAAAGDARRDLFLLAHELFHLVSWNDRELRDDLYALLGFERFTGFEPPPELESRRLSNPGGHTYTHAIVVETPDGPASVVPFVRSSVPLEEIIGLPQGAAFFGVLEILLLPVDTATGTLVRGTAGELVSYTFDDTDWVQRLGRNTSYVIHPEEVMADNFASLVEWRVNGVAPTDTASGLPVDDPGLLRAIEDVLAEGCP